MLSEQCCALLTISLDRIMSGASSHSSCSALALPSSAATCSNVAFSWPRTLLGACGRALHCSAHGRRCRQTLLTALISAPAISTQWARPHERGTCSNQRLDRCSVCAPPHSGAAQCGDGGHLPYESRRTGSAPRSHRAGSARQAQRKTAKVGADCSVSFEPPSRDGSQWGLPQGAEGR